MLKRFINWLSGLFDDKLVYLAIVRRYVDANGHYVGELYVYGMFAGVGAYRLVGCSLDSLPLEITSLSLNDEPGALDLLHDFLAPIAANTLRVGSNDPGLNDNVRQTVGRYKRRNIRILVQNRFIEHVLEKKTI